METPDPFNDLDRLMEVEARIELYRSRRRGVVMRMVFLSLPLSVFAFLTMDLGFSIPMTALFVVASLATIFFTTDVFEPRSVSEIRYWLKEMDDPRDVLEQFLTHLKDQAWTEAASLFSESAVSVMKSGWHGAASSPGRGPRDWEETFLGLATDQDVLAADGLELVAAFLARHDQRNAIRLSLEGEDAFPPHLMAVLSGRIGPFLTPRVIGTVFDGPEEAFVVCRVGEGSVEEFDGSERSFRGEPKTFPLRMERVGWRLVDVLGSALNPGIGITISGENPAPDEELWASDTKPKQG